MTKEQLMQKYNELLEFVAQATLNEMELKANLNKLTARKENAVEDILGIQAELQKMAKEQESKKEAE